MTPEPTTPFQSQVLRKSSLGTPAVTFLSTEPARTQRIPSAAITVNQSGGTGSLVFQDCDGAEVGRISWLNGLIQTDGEQTIESGCDDTSSPGT